MLGMKRNIIIDLANIKRAGKCCEQLYIHEFDSLYEISQFLEKSKLPQLTHCVLSNLKLLRKLNSSLKTSPDEISKPRCFHQETLPNIWRINTNSAIYSRKWKRREHLLTCFKKPILSLHKNQANIKKKNIYIYIKYRNKILKISASRVHNI